MHPFMGQVLAGCAQRVPLEWSSLSLPRALVSIGCVCVCGGMFEGCLSVCLCGCLSVLVCVGEGRCV